MSGACADIVARKTFFIKMKNLFYTNQHPNKKLFYSKNFSNTLVWEVHKWSFLLLALFLHFAPALV